MRYATHLMTAWHDHQIGEHILKCQLELNPVFSIPSSRSSTPQSVGDHQTVGNHPAPGLDQPQTTSSVHSDGEHTAPTEVEKRVARRHPIPRIVNPERTSSAESQLPNGVSASEWEFATKASGTNREVLLVRGTKDRKRQATVKVYPHQHLEIYEQELTALKKLTGNHTSRNTRFNQRLYPCLSITGVRGVAQLIDPEDASNNLAQRRSADGDLWMIMQRAPGYSLKEFCTRVHKSALAMPDTIQLALSLTRIIKQVHDRGVGHQNVSPEHLMIEWDHKNQPISEAQLTLLSFSQTSSLQKWYEAPQASVEGLSSTIDASGVCAILFWLLLQADPRHDGDALPHQQDREALHRAINDAVPRRKYVLIIWISSFSCKR